MSTKKLVSIIITTKNEERNIENCLISITLQTYSPIQIIVVDNNSTDKTKELAKNYTKYVFNKGPERSVQRNHGAQKANGEYVLFIDSDMILSPKVVEQCVKKINAGFKGVIIPEESFGVGFWAQTKGLERQLLLGVNWLEAPRFLRKKTFDEFNGYDAANTGTEDFDLPQRIKAKYGESAIGRITAFIRHNEGNLSLLKTMKKKFYYASNLGSYTIKSENKVYFKKQSSLIQRYLLFFSKPKVLFSNPILGFGMLFMKTSEFVAGGLGYFFRKRSKY